MGFYGLGFGVWGFRVWPSVANRRSHGSAATLSEKSVRSGLAEGRLMGGLGVVCFLWIYGLALGKPHTQNSEP